MDIRAFYVKVVKRQSIRLATRLMETQNEGVTMNENNTRNTQIKKMSFKF